MSRLPPDSQGEQLAVDFSLEDLAGWASRQGIDLGAHQRQLFAAYLERLLLWNRRMSLVSQDNSAEIRCKHFADSLCAAAICGDHESLVDIGTGAGFPGLPIAIVRPACSVLLVESNRKKASFLLDIVTHLDLRNVTVAETRVEAESFLAVHRGKHTMAISRAFAAVSDFLRLALPLLKSDGRAVAMKGPNYAAELLDPRIADLGALLLGEHAYSLPDGVRRVILTFGARRP